MRAYLAVGTNLGDRWAHLASAGRALRAAGAITVAGASRVWDTAPMGPAQPRYLNAVLALETALPVRALFDVLRGIEAAAGRDRTGPRWGPRTLDLDLLLYGAETIAAPDLVVPHPGLAVRRFVLAPLAELAPGLVVPGLGQTVAELLAAAPEDDLVPVGSYPG
jgi:2-amino-4-hydroxy-6-hydroxymethyldihydropteridine diphosphokinase